MQVAISIPLTEDATATASLDSAGLAVACAMGPEIREALERL